VNIIERHQNWVFYPFEMNIFASQSPWKKIIEIGSDFVLKITPRYQISKMMKRIFWVMGELA